MKDRRTTYVKRHLHLIWTIVMRRHLFQLRPHVLAADVAQ
jgi:hypothetical protein